MHLTRMTKLAIAASALFLGTGVAAAAAIASPEASEPGRAKASVGPHTSAGRTWLRRTNACEEPRNLVVRRWLSVRCRYGCRRNRTGTRYRFARRCLCKSTTYLLSSRCTGERL